MATFADLGTPFPLFAAPVEEAVGYRGPGHCDLCGADSEHCFVSRFASTFIPCPHCGEDKGGAGTACGNRACISCGRELATPHGVGNECVSCYACLRQGRLMLSKDTEFGEVTWEYAWRGLTKGLPGLTTNMFEMVAVSPIPPPESQWKRARVPKEYLFELLRTPDFLSWGDPRWLFCCRRPMTYLGNWVNLATSPHGEHLGDVYLTKVFESAGWGLFDDRSRTGLLAHDPEVYTFQCKICGRYRGTCDAS